jgi:hypothetical protein
MAKDYLPPDTQSQQLILFPIPADQLLQLAAKYRESIVEDFAKLLSQQEKLLSPSEACELFIPRITRSTLAAYTKKGHLKQYRIGNSRPVYKLSEILEAAKTLKKYKR